MAAADPDRMPNSNEGMVIRFLVLARKFVRNVKRRKLKPGGSPSLQEGRLRRSASCHRDTARLSECRGRFHRGWALNWQPRLRLSEFPLRARKLKIRFRCAVFQYWNEPGSSRRASQ